VLSSAEGNKETYESGRNVQIACWFIPQAELREWAGLYTKKKQNSIQMFIWTYTGRNNFKTYLYWGNHV
jgi:hypothetical protein